MHLYKLLDYGTEELPLAVWQVKFDAGNLQFRKNDEHRHDCMEVMFVTRGSGVCRINGAAYPVLRGDLYIITPEDVHSYLLDPECEFYNILFEPEFFATVPELAAIIAKWRKNREHPQVVFLSPDKIDHLTTLAERMTDELHSRRRGAQWLARCLFGEFMVELIRQQEFAQITAPPPGQPQTASRILTYIERHLHGELSLRQLARLAGMSDSTFSSFTRAQRRMSRARLSLRSVLALSEITAISVAAKNALIRIRITWTSSWSTMVVKVISSLFGYARPDMHKRHGLFCIRGQNRLCLFYVLHVSFVVWYRSVSV